MAPGVSVYGEQTIKFGGEEYRVWDPYRSKLSAAILKGLRDLPIKPGCRVLYLGASTGTTVSHVSDIIGGGGVVYAVEISHRVARELLDRVVKFRRNVVPVIEDARKPERYMFVYGKVDVEYCDIAQPDQTEIAIDNAKKYLRREGSMLLVVKSRSIDVVKSPEEITREEARKLVRSGFKIEQIVNLEPYDKDHSIILARYLG